MKQKIEISYKTILFIAFLVLFLLFLYKIVSILILFFVSYLIASAITPLVDKMQKRRIPRGLAIIIIYILIILVLSLVLSSIVPALIEQTSILAENMSTPLSSLPFLRIDLNTLSNQLELISRNVVGLLKIVISAAGNILTILALLVLTFYLSYEKKNLNMYLEKLFDGEKKAKVMSFIKELDRVLGGWLIGQLTLMLIIGLTSYLGLLVLGVHFALPLALLAGLLEFIPNLGPTLALVPAALVAWSMNPLLGVGTIVLYIVIQQLENYIIVPQVMRRAVGIHPLVSLLCLLIGGKIYGFIGVLLAIPVFLLLRTIFLEFHFKNS